MPQLTITPCAVLQAQIVLRDPERYAEDPTLLHLAHLVAASATGATPRQTRPGTQPTGAA